MKALLAERNLNNLRKEKVYFSQKSISKVYLGPDVSNQAFGRNPRGPPMNPLDAETPRKGRASGSVSVKCRVPPYTTFIPSQQALHERKTELILVLLALADAQNLPVVLHPPALPPQYTWSRL